MTTKNELNFRPKPLTIVHNFRPETDFGKKKKNPISETDGIDFGYIEHLKNSRMAQISA